MNRYLVVMGLILMLNAVSSKAWAQTATDVIAHAQLMDQNKRERYLLEQAQDFFNKKQYDAARDLAHYILANLNPNSQEAKGIINHIEKLNTLAPTPD